LRELTVAVRDETVSFSLELNVEKAYEGVRKLQTILYRSLELARRLGDENLDGLIRKLQQLLILINNLRLAYRALQLARMAAGDPIAWALAGLTLMEVALDVGTTSARELAGSGDPQ
jgi:hypothetical protein